MVGALLLRGMLAGLFAGLLAFGFARVVGEPAVERAIAFEAAHEHLAHDHAAGDHGGHAHDAAAPGGHGQAAPVEAEEPDLFSRATQAGIGLFTGVVVYGAALGGLFALVFAFVQGRVGRLGARGTAAALALAGFVAIVLAPGLKYPPNPPAVGVAATIGARTALYFGALALSLLALGLAVSLGRALTGRFGSWTGTVAAGAAYLLAVGIVAAILPAIDEVPADFSASLLWQFRLASFGIQAVLWTALGLAFGLAAERALAAGRRTPPAPVFAPR